MKTQEIFEKYGRRFLVIELGEDRNFSFYEIKTEDGEIFVVNRHVLIYQDEEVLIREQVEFSIEELAEILEVIPPEATVNLVPNTKFRRLCNAFLRKAEIFYDILIEGEYSDKEACNFTQELLKISRNIELAETFRTFQ